jgi:prepilin-type N-terminal cleavage/methylation domain-containing protein
MLKLHRHTHPGAGSKTRRATAGFTLVELIITIAIIAILATIGAVSYNSVIGRANQTANQAQAVQVAKLVQVQSALTRALPVTGPFTGAVLADLESIAGPNASGITVSEAGLITVTAAKNNFMSGCTITASTIVGGTNTVVCEGISVNAGSGSGGGGGNSGDGGGGAQPAALSLSYASTAFTMGSNNQSFAATVTGGDGSETFAYTGTLPTGVAFDADTGAFTGPAANAWNFKATQIAVGGYHACARTTAGTVKCWGYNDKGQLGDGTTATKSSPVDVLASANVPLTGVASISATDKHTCALMTSGGVKCWGLNSNGQLGDNATTNRSFPVDMLASSGVPITGVSSVSAGLFNTCVIMAANSELRCAGRVDQQNIPGKSNNTNVLIPTQLSPDQGSFSKISVGASHMCGILTNSDVKCWGYNENFQTNGTGQTGAIAIDSAYFGSCAVFTGGTVKCWGTTATSSGDRTPRQGVTTIGGVSNAISIDATTEYSWCSALSTGGQYCWGGNFHDKAGTSGSPSSLNSTTAGGAVSYVGVGELTTCRLLSTGAVNCSGNSIYGAVGNGSTTNTSVPITTVGNFTGSQPGFPVTGTVTVTAGSNTATSSVTLTAE